MKDGQLKDKIIEILENHTKYTLIDRNMFRLISDEIFALIEEQESKPEFTQEDADDFDYHGNLT